MFDALCNLAWEWFLLYRVGKNSLLLFYIFQLKKNNTENKKSNVLFGAVGKAKTTCAVGERWEGRDLGFIGLGENCLQRFVVFRVRFVCIGLWLMLVYVR